MQTDETKGLETIRIAPAISKPCEPELNFNRTRVSNPSLYHSLITPASTYAPWLADELFLKVYNALRTYTLVDIYRCFELWHLVEQIAKLDAGAIIEVGVWRGGTAALIAMKAMLCNIIEPMFVCDTFEGVVKISDMDSTYKGGEHSDTSEELVRSLFNTLLLTNVRILKGVFPDQTSPLYKCT